jgi:hypothetical protein
MNERFLLLLMRGSLAMSAASMLLVAVTVTVVVTVAVTVVMCMPIVTFSTMIAILVPFDGRRFDSSLLDICHNN